MKIILKTKFPLHFYQKRNEGNGITMSTKKDKNLYIFEMRENFT